jgi:hypothetical protein
VRWRDNWPWQWAHAWGNCPFEHCKHVRPRKTQINFIHCFCIVMVEAICGGIAERVPPPGTFPTYSPKLPTANCSIGSKTLGTNWLKWLDWNRQSKWVKLRWVDRWWWRSDKFNVKILGGN